MEARSLILLSCSHEKRSGGEHFDSASRCLYSEAFLPSEGPPLLDRRRRVLGLLHGKPTRLYNEDQKGGFRDERGCNRKLVPGPDFGDTDPGKDIYLPAWKRHAGRFFAQLETESPRFWKAIPSQPVEILLVCGLYGVVLWDELIQEYDSHFNDYTKDKRRETVAEIWDGVLTDVLYEFIRNQAERTPIRHVYDLLSEATYQQRFGWEKIARAGVQVYHRIFKGLAGTNILSSLATILARQLPRFYRRTQGYEYDQWYNLPGDHDSPIRYGFESQIGRNIEATREGELDEARASVLETYPGLRTVPDAVDAVALAEHSWGKVQHLAAFDFGTMTVSYTKAVECYLREVVPSCRSKATLGQIQKHVSGMKGWSEVDPLLRTLSKLREGHPRRRRATREHVIMARDFALQVFKEGERIRQGS